MEVRRCWAIGVETTEIEASEIEASDWPALTSLCRVDLCRVEAERHHPDGTTQTEKRLFPKSGCLSPA